MPNPTPGKPGSDFDEIARKDNSLLMKGAVVVVLLAIAAMVIIILREPSMAQKLSNTSDQQQTKY